MTNRFCSLFSVRKGGKKERWRDDGPPHSWVWLHAKHNTTQISRFNSLNLLISSTCSVTERPDEGVMSSCAGQDAVDHKRETQNTTSSPVAAVDSDGNIDDDLNDMTEYVTGWRLVAVAIALVMSIFLVWLPRLER